MTEGRLRSWPQNYHRVRPDSDIDAMTTIHLMTQLVEDPYIIGKSILPVLAESRRPTMSNPMPRTSLDVGRLVQGRGEVTLKKVNTRRLVEHRTRALNGAWLRLTE